MNDVPVKCLAHSVGGAIRAALPFPMRAKQVKR